MSVIYFAGSITGGRADVSLYRAVVESLEAGGHTVLAGAVASEHVGEGGEPIAAAGIFARDLRWLDEADLIVAEVSMPSTGTGYEIAYARHGRGIPAICLYRSAHTARCSAMISGDPGIELIEYASLDELMPRLLESIARYSRFPVRLP